MADKVGNAGDEIRKQAGNVGDDLTPAAIDRASPRATTPRPRARSLAQADGDESLADKVGNAGDDIRNKVSSDR